MQIFSASEPMRDSANISIQRTVNSRQCQQIKREGGIRQLKSFFRGDNLLKYPAYLSPPHTEKKEAYT
jgi:hypothetical protein